MGKKKSGSGEKSHDSGNSEKLNDNDMKMEHSEHLDSPDKSENNSDFNKSFHKKEKKSKSLQQDENESKSYEKWEKLKGSLILKTIDENLIEEKQGDIFEIGKNISMAHCVAEDLAMGAGIAKQFKQIFKGCKELEDQRVTQGGVAFLEVDNRYIYYLVTKRESTLKPTYETLYRSLNKLKDLTLEHKVHEIAIPRLGCGLDRLEWLDVKSMIAYIFEHTDVKFTVCNFQQNHGKAKPKLVSTKTTKTSASNKDGKVKKKRK